jgi:hypothetical protein
VTADNAASACRRHMPVPSTSVTACSSTPDGRHGAQNPNGSPGITAATTRSSRARPVGARYHHPRSTQSGLCHRPGAARPSDRRPTLSLAAATRFVPPPTGEGTPPPRRHGSAPVRPSSAGALSQATLACLPPEDAPGRVARSATHPGAAPAPPAYRHNRRMPWATDRPRSRRYGPEHQAERARHMRALRLAGSGVCAERVCIMRSRVITPDMDLHLCHDPTGTRVLGLGHAACNRREAAVRARKLQGRNSGRNAKAKARRSQLRW